MSYCIYRVTQTKQHPTWVIVLLCGMLLGGVVASQTWCWKLSKRLFHPYRRAYGTQPKHGDHIDNYTPASSSNGTGSSTDTVASSNGVKPSTNGPLAGIEVGGSFPLADNDMTTTPKEGKKLL
jgi:hypothetical protein